MASTGAQVTALGVLNNATEPEVSGGSLNAESTAQAFIELCDKGDIPYESPQPQPGDAYLMRRWWEQGKLRQALSNVEDTEGGFIFEDREGELGFHLANYRATRTIGHDFRIYYARRRANCVLWAIPAVRLLLRMFTTR